MQKGCRNRSQFLRLLRVFEILDDLPNSAYLLRMTTKHRKKIAVIQARVSPRIQAELRDFALLQDRTVAQVIRRLVLTALGRAQTGSEQN
jgi:hypothetical protein